MNHSDIKSKITQNIGRKVKITVYGMRNRKEIVTGTITNAYPNVFTVLSRDISKSFTYADVLIGDVKIEYL